MRTLLKALRVLLAIVVVVPVVFLAVVLSAPYCLLLCALGMQSELHALDARAGEALGAHVIRFVEWRA